MRGWEKKVEIQADRQTRIYTRTHRGAGGGGEREKERDKEKWTEMAGEASDRGLKRLAKKKY